MPSKAALALKPKVRSRIRATNVEATSTDEQRDAKIKAQMIAWHTSNRTMNEAKKQAEDHKAEAERLMALAGHDYIRALDTNIGVSIEATFVKDGESKVVNVKRLRKEVSEKTFFEMVSATQKSVSDAVGKNILGRVIDVVTKEPFFKISTVK